MADGSKVALSTTGEDPEVQRILANGANAYLTKPLDVHEVLEAVDSFLDRPDGTRDQSNPTEAVG